MNAIISRIKKYARSKPNAVAYTVFDAEEQSVITSSITWKELDDFSGMM